MREGVTVEVTALTVAAAQQLLLALTFAIIPFVALAYGDRVQRAAERSVADQGIDVDGETLRRSGAQFSESRAEMLLPLGIAVLLVATATAALMELPIAWALTWVIEIALLVVVGAVTYGQVFPARYLKRAWARSDDERLRRIDVDELMRAAGREFPGWLRPLQIMRFLLATVGSVLVMILLLVQVR